MNNDIRSITKRAYDIDIVNTNPVSNKSYKAICKNGNCYFIKETDIFINEKFKYLGYQGVDNVIYPIRNFDNNYVTKKNTNLYYVTKFYSPNTQINELKAINLNNQLQILHNNTYVKKQLSVEMSRKKIEEMYEYLQYKFSIIEIFVRTIESQPFDEYSITILKNYKHILDAKKIMAKLQKKIIVAIKDKKSVNYSFIHNNPKLSHIINYEGNNYLISLEKSKLGISSLDMAKFYIETEDVVIDKKEIIQNYFNKFEDEFYFDYFCFLVLLFYIKGLIINDKDYVSSQSFLYTSNVIKKFIATFNLIT